MGIIIVLLGGAVLGTAILVAAVLLTAAIATAAAASTAASVFGWCAVLGELCSKKEFNLVPTDLQKLGGRCPQLHH